MVRANALEKISSRTRKIAQRPPSPEELSSQRAVLLDVLKTVEVELQKRGLLKIPTHGTFHPIWFLAETERNVFLWRTGCSLIEKDEFEFWIDVRRLLEKRLQSIERAESENPFSNPHWGNIDGATDYGQDERAYLTSFMTILETIEDHAHALCLVAQSVLKELCAEATLRETVLLPTPKRPPA